MTQEAAGERLKKIRLEKGLSLEEVQKKTKIHLNILKAIEGDALTNLKPIYLKGFIKIYCKFLGQDPKEFMPDYKEIQSFPVTTTGKELPRQKSKRNISLLRSATLKLSSWHPSKKVKKTIGFIVLVIIFVILLFNVGKFIAAKRAAIPPSVKGENKRETKMQKGKTSLISPKPVAREVKLQKNAASGIVLGIRAKENCWVSLKVDGRLVFQRVLEKGRFESWQAKEKMELSLGNAGVVELEVNGQLFSNLGRKGQTLKNISITKEGLNIRR